MALHPLAASLLIPLCLLGSCAEALGQSIRTSHTPPLGIAWRVQGDWKQESRGSSLHSGRAVSHPSDTVLHSGDTVLPGALLMPVDLKATHSITLLLPDGQRILYECFTEEDCERGFRIPALTEAPSPFAAGMMRAMSKALIENRLLAQTDPQLDPTPAPPTRQAHTTVAGRDEAFAVLDRERRARVTGTLSSLPNGQYTYNLQPLDRRQPARFHISLEKTTTECVFPVPAAGLYEVSIWDSQDTPRIDLFLAAVEPDRAGRFATYPKAKKLLAEWDENYYGWPVHDLLRAYLQALMRTTPTQPTTRAETGGERLPPPTVR